MEKNVLPEKLRWFSIAAVIVVVFCVIAKAGTQGPLVLDSVKLMPIEQDVATRGLSAVLSPSSFNPDGRGETGRVSRPLSFSSFAANIYFADDLIPAHLKWTNAGLHLLIGFLVFLLSNQLWRLFVSPARARWLALLVSAMWIFAPANLTAVFYAVQRMAQLSMLFIVLGLYAYVRARQSDLVSRRCMWVGISLGVCLPLAYLSKENGILLLPLIATVEATVWRFRDWPLTPRFWYAGIFVGGFGSVLAALWFLPEFFDYSGRAFGMWERLMTQSRVLFSYLGNLLLPWQPDAGIYNDGFPVSRGLFSPITTATSILGVLSLIAAGAVLSRRWPLLGLGILFFFAGHLIESTVLPLEMYFLHRNYLPSVGIFLSIASIVDWSVRRVAQRWVLLGLSVYIGLFLLVGHGKSSTWSTRESIVTQAVRFHPESRRATSAYAQLLLDQGRVNESMNVLDYSLRNHPPETRLPTLLQKLFVLCLADQPIPEGFYHHLQESPGQGLDIEISQAFSNILRLYEREKCPQLEVSRFVPAIDHMAEQYQAMGRDSWQVAYYANAFLYSSGERMRVYQRLQERFEAGEVRAGWYLMHLYSEAKLDEKALELKKRLEKPAG